MLSLKDAAANGILIYCHNCKGYFLTLCYNSHQFRSTRPTICEKLSTFLSNKTEMMKALLSLRYDPVLVAPLFFFLALIFVRAGAYYSCNACQNSMAYLLFETHHMCLWSLPSRHFGCLPVWHLWLSSVWIAPLLLILSFLLSSNHSLNNFLIFF